MTLSAELIAAQQPKQALAALTDEVRKQPGNAKLRVFLAQLLCVLGQWKRAIEQMDTAAQLDASAIPMRQMYGEAALCEAVRERVFAGQSAPMLFGEPETWTALLIESLLRRGKGEHEAAEAMRAQAFEQAPASAGRVDGQPFEWFADADMRLGPVLEAFINGRYYWVPMNRLSCVRLEKPEDLRDQVWLPVHLDFTNGGETLALVPSRYPGSQASEDGALQLARKTERIELQPEVWTGVGQRMFGSDAGDHPMLGLERIEFTAAV